MNELAPVSPVSPLRQRLIDDMVELASAFVV